MTKEEINFINEKIKEIRKQYKNEYLQLEEDKELADKFLLESVSKQEKVNTINEIQEDLDMRFQFNGYESEFFDKQKKQICIIFKNTKTKEFYNKFFDYSIIYPKRKTTANLAYLLYYLYELDDYEIFILNNILRSNGKQRRAQKNIIFSNIIYVDIDKVKGSESLDVNTEDYAEILSELLYENYDFLDMFPNIEFNFNYSGSGLHLYFKINSIYMNEENKKRYLDITRSLAEIFGGDFNCVDTARILRPCKSYNKKDKFIVKKRVECLGMGNICTSYTLKELENMIDTYYHSKRKIYTKEELAFGFVPIECEESPFDDEPITITPKIKIEQLLEIEKNTKEVKRKQKTEEYFSLTDYEENNEFPNHYLIQDLLFYIKNRGGNCEGFRRNLLFVFYFCFKKYCLMSDSQSRKYVFKVNNLFKEKLSKKEIEELLNYLSDYKLYCGIRNNKVYEFFKFKEEEIIYMRGSYNLTPEERRIRKLEKDRRIKKEKYTHKKPTHKQIEICIKNNSDKTNKELAELIGVSARTIQRVKRELL